jgi:guanine deaminase
MKAGHRIGLATDTGGGSSFSMLRTMAAAYEIGSCGHALHPAQLWWLATGGLGPRAAARRRPSARSRRAIEADIIAVDLASTPAIAQRMRPGRGSLGSVFPTIMMGDDRAIVATYVAGRRIDA